MSRKRVLLDENLPHKLRTLLTECDVFTVAYMQWIGVRNGELLAAAERECFDVLVTSDTEGTSDYSWMRSLRG